ncbi:MAG: FkbM family methyltransferase [Christensenellaceae bacterium]
MLIIKEKISLWEHLKAAQKPIFLYGMGDGAEKILKVLEKNHISVSGIFASDEFCRYQMFRGFEVCKYGDIMHKDFIVLVAFGTQRREVLENIRKIASEQELYAPDVPVFGDGIFDRDFFEEHEREFAQVYEMLADETSKILYENLINYKISGKTAYLEFDAKADCLSLTNHETYVDAGAYTGDTIHEFVQCASGYDAIFAIEPDRKNFEKLKRNTKDLKNIFLFHAAAANKDGKIGFEENAGRNSVCSEQSETQVSACTIDKILDKKQATYIKYDVEGKEISALEGTRHTIMQNKPKLCVSAYHRNEDLFAIPLYIKNIRADYRVYVRKCTYIPAWDIQFYFI